MPTDKTISDARPRLVEAAIRLLATNGPSEVKARSVSNEAGLSTMGVYSYFGGVPELLQAVADEGFARQAAIFERVATTDDPMADLCAMALACRDFAKRSPHLYDLMFGLSIHGRYTPTRGTTASEPREKSAAFKASYSYLLGKCTRLVDTNCVRKIDPDLMAAQLWSSLHGFIMLELGGHFTTVADPASKVLVQMCINLIVGLGANRESAASSAAVATARWESSLDVRSRTQRNRKARSDNTN